MSLRTFRGLRAQLLLWTILPFALLLIMLAVAGIISHRRAMEQLVEERDRSLVLVEATRLGRQIEALRDRLADLTGDPGLHRDRALAIATAKSQNAELAAETQGSLVLLEGLEQVLFAAEDAEGWLTLPGVRGVLEQAQATGRPQIAEVSPPGELPLLVAAAPVPRLAGDETRRFLLAAFPLESLDLAASSDVVRTGKWGVTYLLSSSGLVLHHADPARLSLPPPTPDQLPELKPGGTAVSRFRSGGRLMIATYGRVDLLGWTLVMEEPLNDLIPPLLRSIDVLPLLLLFVAVVALLALYFSVRWVIWPLQELDRRASRVAWGDFDAISRPVGGVQEIEDLRRTLEQMAERLRAYQTGMRDYLAAVTQAQEEERRRLARELHDDTTQSLIGLRQRVEMVEKALVRDPDRVPERLARLRELIDETLAGVRRFIRNLRPLYLEDLGFVPALEAMARDMEVRYGLSMRVQITGMLRRLPPDIELAAFRIVQEGLNNVAQHARATAATLSVDFGSQGLTLRIEDNGIGFDPPEQPHDLAVRGHFGLMGMRERTLLYGGHLSIKSSPGEGTTVVAWLPFLSHEDS